MSGINQSAGFVVGPAREGPTIFVAIAAGQTIDHVVAIQIGGLEPTARAASVEELRLRIDGHPVAGASAAEAPAAAPCGQGKRGCGRLEVDVDQHRVFVEGKAVHLTAMELRLLNYLLERRDRLCRRADILVNVWGTVGDTSRRTLNTHANRLRVKLARAGVRLETVRNVGLRLTEEAPAHHLSRRSLAVGAMGRHMSGESSVTPLLPRGPARAAAGVR